MRYRTLAFCFPLWVGTAITIGYNILLVIAMGDIWSRFATIMASCWSIRAMMIVWVTCPVWSFFNIVRYWNDERMI